MPRLGARVALASPKTGRWHVESPPGAKVFEQSFEQATSLSTELTVSGYSAVLYVNGGTYLSFVKKPEYKIAQKLMVTVGEQVGFELPGKIRESPSVGEQVGFELPGKIRESPSVKPTDAYGELQNKVRTVVSIS
jgi:hypothetical protein